MSATSNANTVIGYEAFRLTNYGLTAAVALACHEYLVTFTYEIETLRKRKWNAGTWILVLNRYLMVANAILEISPSSFLICNNAAGMNILIFIVDGALSDLPGAVFGVLRALALLKHDRWKLPVLSLLIALNIFIFAANTYVDFITQWTYIIDPLLGSGCYLNGFSASPASLARLNLATVVAAIIADLIVIAITMLKTVRHVRESRSLGMQPSLGQTMLRDGSLYFMLCLVFDVTQTLATMAGAVANAPISSVVSSITEVLCLISLSRFIINLRQNDHSDDETLTENGQSHSKIRYQPFLDHLIGNLGETLDFEAKYLETDDAETTGKDGSDDSTDAKRLSYLARGCRKTESGEVSGHDDPAILEEEDIQEVPVDALV